MKKIFKTAILVVASSVYGFGQATVSHTITIEIQNRVDIRVKPSTTLNTNFVLDNMEEHKEGIEVLQAGIFQVQSTGDWLVQAKSNSNHFNYSGDQEGINMSTSLLKIKNNSASDFLSLSEQGMILVNGSSGDFSSNEFAIDYKFEPNLAFPSGIYSVEVALTVSNP